MIITGRIFDIVHLNEKTAQIVLRKKLGDKIVPVAVEVFGYWRDKAIDLMKLKPKDKIRGNLYLKSRLYNGKYYTDVFFKEVYLVEEHLDAIKNASGNLFKTTEGGRVDTDTGEFIEEEKSTNEQE